MNTKIKQALKPKAFLLTFAFLLIANFGYHIYETNRFKSENYNIISGSYYMSNFPLADSSFKILVNKNIETNIDFNNPKEVENFKIFISSLYVNMEGVLNIEPLNFKTWTQGGKLEIALTEKIEQRYPEMLTLSTLEDYFLLITNEQFIKDNIEENKYIMRLAHKPFEMLENITSKSKNAYISDIKEIEYKISSLNDTYEFYSNIKDNSLFYSEKYSLKEETKDELINSWVNHRDILINEDNLKSLAFDFKLNNYEIVNKNNLCFIKYPNDINIDYTTVGKIEYTYDSYDFKSIDCNITDRNQILASL